MATPPAGRAESISSWENWAGNSTCNLGSISCFRIFPGLIFRLVRAASSCASWLVRFVKWPRAFILYHSVIFPLVWTGGRVCWPSSGKVSPGSNLRIGFWVLRAACWDDLARTHSSFSLRNFSIRLSDKRRGARITTPFSGWIWMHRVRRDERTIVCCIDIKSMSERAHLEGQPYK